MSNRIFGFLSILRGGLFSNPRGRHLTTFYIFVAHRRHQSLPFFIEFGRHISYKILDRIHVKYVLSKGRLILKNVAIPLSKSRLNLATRWNFTSTIQCTNVIVGLKLLNIGKNVTTVLSVQRKNLNLVQDYFEWRQR